jgi:hypothetical protein
VPPPGRPAPPPGRRTPGGTINEPVSIETLWARRDELSADARAIDPAAVRALIERAEREGWDAPAVQAEYRAFLAGEPLDQA